MDAEDFFGKQAGHYLLASLLGVGANSRVYQAIDTTLADSPIFAIKCMPMSCNSERLLQQTAEILNHKSVVRCPNVLTLHDVMQEDGYFFLVFPLCEMDMFKAIWKEKVYWKNDFLIKKAFLEVLDGVYACHKMGIYHRDLKPENIMCNADGLRIQVGDFGLATDTSISEDGGCGTPPYMSPECWDAQTEYTFPGIMDIWSLGVILFNMVTSQYPWEQAHAADQEFMAFLNAKDYLLHKYPISKSLHALLVRIWHPCPPVRPSIPTIREAVLAMNTFYRAASCLRHGAPAVLFSCVRADSQRICFASKGKHLFAKRKGCASLESHVPANIPKKDPLCYL